MRFSDVLESIFDREGYKLRKDIQKIHDEHEAWETKCNADRHHKNVQKIRRAYDRGDSSVVVILTFEDKKIEEILREARVSSYTLKKKEMSNPDNDSACYAIYWEWTVYFENEDDSDYSDYY